MTALYHVEIRRENGELATVRVEAINPGSAFYKALRLHPKCKLLGAFLQSRIAGRELRISYDPPSVTTASREENLQREEQLEMPFMHKK